MGGVASWVLRVRDACWQREATTQASEPTSKLPSPCSSENLHGGGARQREGTRQRACLPLDCVARSGRSDKANPSSLTLVAARRVRRRSKCCECAACLSLLPTDCHRSLTLALCLLLTTTTTTTATTTLSAHRPRPRRPIRPPVALHPICTPPSPSPSPPPCASDHNLLARACLQARHASPLSRP
jgi:hypothetical protein